MNRQLVSSIVRTQFRPWHSHRALFCCGRSLSEGKSMTWKRDCCHAANGLPPVCSRQPAYRNTRSIAHRICQIQKDLKSRRALPILIP